MPRTKAKSVFDGSLPLKRWGQNEIGMGHCAASKVQMISHDDHLRVKPLQQCRMLKRSSQGSRIKKEYFGIKQNHITRDQPKKIGIKIFYTQTPLGACLSVHGRIKKHLDLGGLPK